MEAWGALPKHSQGTHCVYQGSIEGVGEGRLQSHIGAQAFSAHTHAPSTGYDIPFPEANQRR